MHKSRLCYITIDVNDHNKAIAFWSAALGAKRSDNKSWEQSSFRRLKVPHLNVELLLQLVPENKTSKSRVHLDLEASDINAEAQRLVYLGAKVVKPPASEGLRFYVMEDPFENEFCILDTQYPELLDQSGTKWD